MAFTNYIQQIKDTNNTTHDLVDTSASHYVKGTQTASTYAWTGALPDGVTEYHDGLSIDYFLPYAGTSTAATLNLGSKGAKPVYVGNSTTQVTTHYPQYSVIHLTYVVNSGLNSGNGAWKATGYYDTNTNNAVTQTNTPGSGSGENASFRVLFSGTADDTTRTEGARKTNSLTYNPSSKLLTVDGGVIKAHHGKFSFLEAEDLQAGTATVTGLLDVKGELHTNKWTNTNIANVGGSFYVSPTYKSSIATIAVSGSANNRTITITSAAFGSASSSGLPVSSWTSDSVILLTGSVTYNNITYPLGTCKGTLSAPLSQTGATIQGVSSSALETLYSIFGTNSVDGVDIEISLLTIGGTKPVGILLTSYGTSQSTYLDIYGGTYSNTGSPTVPNAEPNLRIGYLGNGTTNYNLQKLGGNSEYPKGWGIYTENGYFKGTIVASSGKIGDGTAAWTIGNDGNNRAYIWSGISNITTSGSTTGIYVGTNGISNYSSATQYVNLTGGKITAQGADIQGKITASEGVIGGWNISTDSTKSLYYRTDGGSSTIPTPGSGVIILSKGLISTTSIAGSTGQQTWTITAGNQFGVTTEGKLYATEATLKGITIQNTNGNKVISIGASGLQVFDNGGYLRADYSGSINLYGGNSSTGAAPYINIDNTNGITILKDTTHKVTIDATNGLLIYAGDASNAVAQFSSTIRLGSNTGFRTEIDSDTFSINNGNEYIAYIGYENKQITDTFVSDGSTTNYTLSETPTGNGTVSPSSVSVSRSGTTLTVNSGLPAVGESFTYTYTPNTAISYYTMGKRDETKGVGSLSFAEGYNTVASGSHSHACGYYSKALGINSYAIGYYTNASGKNSCAIGSGTRANFTCQTAVGCNNSISSAIRLEKFIGDGTTQTFNLSSKNKKSTRSSKLAEVTIDGVATNNYMLTYVDSFSGDTYASIRFISGAPASGASIVLKWQEGYLFTVGNGQNTSSNALNVDWDGNLLMAGSITASGHSSPIGTIPSTVSGTKSIPHNTWTNMDNMGLTLDPGTWIIIGTAAFPSKTSGRIGVRIRNYTASANNDVARTLVPYGAESAISCVAFTSIDTSSVFYLQVYQSCGSQVTTGTCYMKAVRIC